VGVLLSLFLIRPDLLALFFGPVMPPKRRHAAAAAAGKKKNASKQRKKSSKSPASASASTSSTEHKNVNQVSSSTPSPPPPPPPPASSSTTNSSSSSSSSTSSTAPDINLDELCHATNNCHWVGPFIGTVLVVAFAMLWADYSWFTLPSRMNFDPHLDARLHIPRGILQFKVQRHAWDDSDPYFLSKIVAHGVPAIITDSPASVQWKALNKFDGRWPTDAVHDAPAFAKTQLGHSESARSRKANRASIPQPSTVSEERMNVLRNTYIDRVRLSTASAFCPLHERPGAQAGKGRNGHDYFLSNLTLAQMLRYEPTSEDFNLDEYFVYAEDSLLSAQGIKALYNEVHPDSFLTIDARFHDGSYLRLGDYRKAVSEEMQRSDATEHTRRLNVDDHRLHLSDDHVQTNIYIDSPYEFVTQITGKTRWALFPPTEVPYLYLYPTVHNFRMTSQVDMLRPDAASRLSHFGKARGLRATLKSGEVLFVPPYWPRSVANTGFSASIRSRATSYEESVCSDLRRIRPPFNPQWNLATRGLAGLQFLHDLLAEYFSYKRRDLHHRYLSTLPGSENSSPLVHFTQTVMATRYSSIMRQLLRATSDDMRAHISDRGCFIPNDKTIEAGTTGTMPTGWRSNSRNAVTQLLENVKKLLRADAPHYDSMVLEMKRPSFGVADMCLADIVEEIAALAVGKNNAPAYVQYCFVMFKPEHVVDDFST
jgi:Cupin-like domain